MDHVETFLKQVLEERCFGEFVTESYTFPTFDQAVGSIRTANKIDQRPSDWYIFQHSEKGYFFVESDPEYVAKAVNRGRKIVATVNVFGRVEVVK